MKMVLLNKMALSLSIMLLFWGCGSYHYSSQPPQKPQVTTISSLTLKEFSGWNMQSAYKVWFNDYLATALLQHSHITLQRDSKNHLHVNVQVAPVTIKRYRDTDIFKNRVYVIDKRLHLDAEYELFDSKGKSICESSYSKSSVSSSSSTQSYHDAEKSKPLRELEKGLMRGLAEAIAKRVVESTNVP
jgi:hypothetical protein